MGFSVRGGSPMPAPSFSLPAISSHSLGRVYAGHDLRTKLHAAASHTIRGIELVEEDLYAVPCLVPGDSTHSNFIATPSFCLPAISSHSLGRVCAGHDLRTKLRVAASHNIRGIELVEEDLSAVACLFPGGPTPANFIAAAHEIRSWTDSLSLTIIELQPFAQYEGLICRTAHAKHIEKAKLWFQIAKVVGTDIILVPSNFLPPEECTSDFDTIVRDMIEVADLGAQENPPIRFAYENLCWGTHIDTWEGVHAVVSAVDRWNFGYCLDTFNIAGRVYGDPAAVDGMTENAEVAMAESMRRMVECVPKEKVFFIQVVDAERVSPPLTKDHPWHVASQPTRMSWSRNARLFAFEEERGGYLPILDVCRAVFEGLGYRGWVSFELFSRTLFETGAEVPDEHAARAARSFEKLVEEFPVIAGTVPKDVAPRIEKSLIKQQTAVSIEDSFRGIEKKWWFVCSITCLDRAREVMLFGAAAEKDILKRTEGVLLMSA